jgi:inward rectifier potassium channel
MAETPPEDPNRDLGFGSRVAQQTRQRLLNRDGSFNVERHGLSFLRSLSLYHSLLTMPWTRFFLLIALGYFATNGLFALAYLACGPGALRGAEGVTVGGRLQDAFFFSVQTLATIGYGGVSPRGLAANLLVTLEALVGLMGFALATGLLFARFSRPIAQIAFSERAVVAPYRGGSALMFRIVNERSNQLIEVRATVTLSRVEMVEGALVRRFHPLELERRKVVFLPLHWVCVHAIDERSPLWGVDEAAFAASDAEVLILLTGVDETFSQTVHARSSYKHDEVVWGARFRDMYVSAADGVVRIDVRRLHEVEKA